MQRIQTEIDAGRNDAADIISLRIHHIEGCAGTKIDNNQGPAITNMRRDCIDQPVRTRLRRGINQRLHAKINALLANHHRNDIKIAAAKPFDIEQGFRHHGGNDHICNIGKLEVIQRHCLTEPNAIFLRRA